MSTSSTPTAPPRWASRWLCAAGNLQSGMGNADDSLAASILRSRRCGTTEHPEIWQCVGMIVGVYGIGYLIAAVDPGLIGQSSWSGTR